MLTLFTTAKPFVGHSAIIQRNALHSWLSLAPDVEIILFGQDHGAAEVAAELGLRHEPFVEQNPAGLNRVDYLFLRAQAIARHNLLCYSNCDIILLPDFIGALRKLRARHREFLMIGRRWDTAVNEPLDFSSTVWPNDLRHRSLVDNRLSTQWFIDYFAFTRGLYQPGIPPLLIGRACWDNCMVARALASARPVVDASAIVHAVHQNHDYGHHPQGKQGVYSGEEALYNLALAGGTDALRTLDDATHRFSRSGFLYPSIYRFKRPVTHFFRTIFKFPKYSLWLPVWHSLLNVTRPVRNYLGLRSRSTSHSQKP